MHEPLAHNSFIAQHAQEPRPIVRGLRELAIVQQAHIGVCGIGEPFHQGRQQDCLNACLAGGSRRQGGQVLKSAVRVVIAQRGQLQLGGLRRKLKLIGRHGDHGIKQRPVEQARVQLGDPQADPAQVRQHALGRRLGALRIKAGDARQPLHPVLVVLIRQRVRAAEALQLQAVLKQAQKLIGFNELGAVLAADVPR